MFDGLRNLWPSASRIFNRRKKSEKGPSARYLNNTVESQAMHTRRPFREAHPRVDKAWEFCKADLVEPVTALGGLFGPLVFDIPMYDSTMRGFLMGVGSVGWLMTVALVPQGPSSSRGYGRAAIVNTAFAVTRYILETASNALSHLVYS